MNAVGLQTGKVVSWICKFEPFSLNNINKNKVSASGDGKMILWDIASGERIRTFEGHDRGLACIEFKV